MLAAIAMALALATASPTEPRRLEPQSRAQLAIARSVAPEVCVSGRRFGGKSWSGCHKAWAYAAIYPGARVAICREERASMEATTLVTLRTEIVPPEVWAACWREQKSALLLPNGSEIHVFGLDRPGRALGARYGLVVIDQAEQLDRNQYEIINSCAMQVGMPFCQTLALFNPDSREHWAYQRFGPDAGDGMRLDAKGLEFAEVIHVLPDDLLGYLTPQSRERFDRLDGVWRLRLRLGQWCAFEGRCFDRWDPALHMVAPPEPGNELESWCAWAGYPPPDWPRYFGIDFGYEPDPFAAGWWAEAPWGVRYLYRQLCHTRWTIEQQAERVNALEAEELDALRACCPAERREELGPYLADLNICGRWSDHHRGERAMLAARGIATSPADKDILASIQTVNELLRPRLAELTAAGEALAAGPQIKIVRGSLAERDPRLREQGKPTCLEEEMGAYIWRADKSGSSLGGLSRQLPRQVNDHCIDGILRYVMHSMAGSQRPAIFLGGAA